MNPKALEHVALATLVAVSQIGCDDVEWPEEKYIDSLRVLGVRAEPPTLTPRIRGSASTRLSVVCVDGSRPHEESPDCSVEIAWFTQCDNPSQNDPKKCFGEYTTFYRDLAPKIAETPAESYPVGFGFGPTFDLSTDETILSQHARVGERDIQYGVSYVYFAVCAGELVSARGSSDRLPVDCRDRNTGRSVSQERFVVGLTAIYSYDVITNHNPILLMSRFDGQEIPNGCDAASQCPPGLVCSSAGECVPVVDRCGSQRPESCRWHCLNFDLGWDSFSLFDLEGVRIRKPQKSLWLDHYTNAGSFPEDVAGFPLHAPAERADVAQSSCVQWQAPNTPTEQAHLWAVVRDNRGGLTLWDQRIIVK